MIEYYTIGLIALLAAISPGPDFVVVVKQAMTQSRHSAVMTSLGIGVGILVHTAYCVLGLAIVISQSILLFNLIKYLGASYLIYLGIKSLLSKQPHIPNSPQQKHLPYSPWQTFRVGLLTNVLNPKCTLFMLSIFTLVVRPRTPTFIQVTYGIEIALISTAWFVFLSYGLSYPIIKSRIEKTQHIVTKLIGAVLITIGIIVIFEAR